MAQVGCADPRAAGAGEASGVCVALQPAAERAPGVQGAGVGITSSGGAGTLHGAVQEVAQGQRTSMPPSPLSEGVCDAQVLDSAAREGWLECKLVVKVRAVLLLGTLV
eukprot:192908-Hanusia_phi.AAC.2